MTSELKRVDGLPSRPSLDSATDLTASDQFVGSQLTE